MVFEIETDRPHEAERLRDAVGELGVAARLRAVLDEAEHPAVDAGEIGVAALGERAQQVQRRRRLAIGFDLAARIGGARRRRELVAVDDVAAVARQFDAVALLGRRDVRGFANWPAMRPILTTGNAAANVITTAICRITRKKSRMLLAPCSAKLSAQSPPWRRKASPAATRARCFFRRRASPAKTSGGKVASCFSTSARAAWSG